MPTLLKMGGVTVVDPRTKPRTCHYCGTSWQAINGGRGRRVSSACDSCYPASRKAQNLWASCRYRAARTNQPFDLTVEWIRKRLLKNCPRTGFVFDLKWAGTNYRNRSPYCPSVDKISPAKGYTQDNCEIVCWWYNLAKSQFTNEEVLEFCKAVISSNT